MESRNRINSFSFPRTLVVLTVLAGLLLASCGPSAEDETETTEAAVETETTEAAVETETTEAADTTGAAEPADSVRLAFAFDPDISMPGFFVSDGLGFYEDEGIELETLVVDGTASVIQQLVAGQADIGIGGPPATILIAGAEGADVIAFYQMDQKSIVSVHVADDSEYESMEDLRGETIGISEFGGGEVPVVRAALVQAGLVEGEDVELLPIGDAPATIAQTLESGDIAAYGGTDAATLGLQALGFEFRNILPEEYNLLPGNVLITTHQYLADNQDLIARFSRTFAMGTYFSSVNPQRSLELGCEFAPESCTDAEFAELAHEYFVDLQQPVGDNYGAINQEGWELAVGILMEGGQLEEDAEWEQFVDLENSIIDEANDFDRASVEEAG